MIARSTLLATAVAATVGLASPAEGAAPKAGGSSAKAGVPIRKSKKPKKGALRKAKMLKSNKLTRKLVPVVGPPVPGENPGTPFANMPSAPIAQAVGGTNDSFAVSPMQTVAQHGWAEVGGHLATIYYWGFWMSASKGWFSVYPEATWMAGHDLSVECWGEWKSGAVDFIATGLNDDDEPEVFASVTVQPPAGGRGRIKVAVPTQGMTPLSYFKILVRDTDGAGTDTFGIYQCIVERDD